jgi:hypothetical protein
MLTLISLLIYGFIVAFRPAALAPDGFETKEGFFYGRINSGPKRH